MSVHHLKFPLLFTFYFLLFTCVCLSQTLAPGKDAQWATAGKQGVGTSAGLQSKVWFTLAQGVMTEVYYPDVTVANVHLLQFVVVNPKAKKVETEQDDAIHQIKVLRPDSLSFQQINTAKSGEWKITKTYTTDVERDSILIDVKFETKNKNLNLYVYYDPSLGNSGMGDTSGHILLRDNYGLMGQKTPALTAEDKNFASVLKTNSSFLGEFEFATQGFLGVNDGLTQLKNSGKITNFRNKAENGNVVQVAKISKPEKFTLFLGFGKNQNEALANANKSSEKGFVATQSEYEKQWSDYVKTLPKVNSKYQAQFNMAAMILKAFEDKTNRGANIASLSIPWGGAANANEVGSSGYHAVWARDLYQVATAFMALGDKDAANRALNFLFKIQQKPDGSFPQNSWLDGLPVGGSLQMDQVGFPLILAHELRRFDRETYQKHIKPAADFIVKNGPTTPQERWEEKGGYSPSTIAAEIAGLVCAAEIAKKNNDFESAEKWLKVADDWAANVEKWTVTTTGKHSTEPYYVRLTQNGKPDAGEKYEINGVFGMVDERDIVDAGFLELVRLGIKSPDDKIIQNSIKVVDQEIRVNTPNGEGFYRYNLDSYGEPDNGQRWNFDGKWTGKGRLWALLSGERGQFEIADCGLRIADFKDQRPKTKDHPIECLDKAKQRLNSMQNFANDGLMIPEQVWDSPEIPKNIDKQFIPELKFGEGTGSATPLAWSMAQFIRLAVNLKEGRNLDTPKVVYERYVLGKKTEASSQKSVVDVSTSCYSDWWDKNKEKVFQKSPIIVKCKDGTYLPIFVYSGKAKNVELVGDFTGWKTQNLVFWKFQPYAPIEGDNLDFSSYRPINWFAPTARVEYKLIVDGKWITDPLNPNKVDNGVGGENSFFTMPDYKPTVWDKGEIPNLETIEISSKIYNERRKVQVYVPFIKSDSPLLPVLYVQDGGNYLNQAKAVQIQQNLVKANKLSPFIMVFLNPKDRMKEYWANDDYAKFLAEEVVPVIDSKYNTIKSRDGRAVMGASLGGITAVHVGLKYPQVFGRIGGQSSSFWIDNQRVIKELEKLDGKTKFKFYFDDGTLEGPEDSRKVAEILKGKGFDVTYIEAEAGHNWTAWRDRLADAFIALWK
jgi:glucoamylase